MVGKEIAGAGAAVLLVLLGAYHLIDGGLWAAKAIHTKGEVVEAHCSSKRMDSTEQVQTSVLSRVRSTSRTARSTGRRYSCDCNVAYEDANGMDQLAWVSVPAGRRSIRKGEQLMISYDPGNPAHARHNGLLPWWLTGPACLGLAFGAFTASRREHA